MSESITWVSANELIERQTREMARTFKASRPRPSNRRMGFNGSDRPKARKLAEVLK